MSKYSIHVGVNTYDPAVYGPKANLRGCISDSHKMQTMATRYGIPIENQVLLHEVRSEAFITALQNIVGKLKANDKLVITVSGHGTRIYNSQSLETDSFEEALCMYDGLVLDDTMGRIFAEAPENSYIEMYSDTCHSADQFKAIALLKQSTQGLYFGFTPEDLLVKSIPAFLNEEAPKKAAPVKFKCKFVQFAGCDEENVSYDTPMGGRFTLAVEKLVNFHNYKPLMAPVLYEGIKKVMGSSQIPQMRTVNMTPIEISNYKIF